MVSSRALAAAWLAMTIAVSLVACDVDGPAPAATVETAAASAGGFDPGPIKTAAEYALEPEFAAADIERGELLGFACAACHKFRAEEGTLIGPNLQGVFGRSAAALEGFEYSPALRGSDLVWTPRSLEAWLANPAEFVAGTTMAFTGYSSAEDRRDLIAYLLSVTQ